MNAVDLIFMPVLAALGLAAVVFIVSRKVLGKMLAIANFAVGALYFSIVTFTGGDTSESAALKMGGVVVLWVFAGLFILYFVQSERVKQTLTK